MQTVRKLTTKVIFGGNPDVEELLKAEGKKMDLALIAGVARKFKPDSSEHGNFVRFYGQFQGVNMVTGERFEAGQAILPGAGQDALYGAMGSEGEAVTVEFAYLISAKYDKDAVTKYVYECRPVTKPKENDPVAQLLKSVEGQLKLPAPKAPAQPDAKKNK